MAASWVYEPRSPLRMACSKQHSSMTYAHDSVSSCWGHT
jgi:hypothetical protein